MDEIWVRGMDILKLPIHIYTVVPIYSLIYSVDQFPLITPMPIFWLLLI